MPLDEGIGSEPAARGTLVELRRAAAAPGSGRLLSWHANEAAIALGFEAGSFALITYAGPGRHAGYHVASGRHKNYADVGAVRVMPSDILGTSASIAMLGGDASGHVRGWGGYLPACRNE